MIRTGLLFLLISILTCFPIGAQNKLSIPEIAGASGRRIQIPVELENADEICAIQFDLAVDKKLELEEVIVPTERFDGHQSHIRKLNDDKYRILCYSLGNKSFRGKKSTLFYLQGNLSPYCAQGEEYPVTLENVTLSGNDTSGCKVDVTPGRIIISQAPDLMVENVSVTEKSANPGEKIECSWDIKNIGTLATQDGFRELIFLTNLDETTKILLQTSTYGSVLQPGQELSHKTVVTIPDVPGVDGKCRIMVRLAPYYDNGEPSSMEANNVSSSIQTVMIGKRLYISPGSNTAVEKNSPVLVHVVTRSGDTSAGEVFDVATSCDDSRLTIPSTVWFEPGIASVQLPVSLTPNGVHDKNDVIVINISGNGYDEAEARLTITDDKPASMEADLSADEVTEGESFDIDIELPYVLNHDATVYISTDQSGRLQFPAQTVIPAGETTTKISVRALDNSEAELDIDATLRVSCNNMEPIELIVTIKDNDMPELALEFSPDIIDEGAGIHAVMATVTRLTNSDKSARIRIFDDSDGELYLPLKSFTMPKGEKSHELMIGVNDNDMVDGDRTFTVTAAVYSQSCDCYASELSGANISKKITITDNDGPHLTLRPGEDYFIEGEEGNVLTVSRNTSPDSDLMVTLTSDNDDLVDYPANIVIPAGEKSVRVMVSVPENDTTTADNVVSFKAEAEGMATGSCRVLITDTTLPDATVSLQVFPSGEETDFVAGGTATLAIIVRNRGNATLPSRIPIEIKEDGGKGSVTVFTDKSVPEGTSESFRIADYRLPSKTGDMNLYAEINGDAKVRELLFSNNKSTPVSLSLLPPFSASVNVDKEHYGQNETVLIEGETTGEAGKSARVRVVIENEGFKYPVDLMTDNEGKFSCIYGLKPAQAGHFNVSAGYPSDQSAEVTATFDVVGLKAEKSYVTFEMKLGETVSKLLYITNPCDMPQTGLKIKGGEKLSTCDFSYKTPASIGPGNSEPVSLSIKGKALSEGEDWEKISLILTTEEGSEIPLTLGYYIHSQKGKLESDLASISATIQMDSSREYPIEIRNTGGGETGLITFSMPDWIKTVTPAELSSLEPGESATVILRFNPWDDMKVNYAQKGYFGINCAKGDGLRIAFEITPVSESHGSLKVDVVDEFSFNTEEKPHVGQAHVTLTHPTSGKVMAEGYTGYDGIFSVDLPEGWYVLKVDAENHSEYVDNVMVNPGRELFEEIFIPFDAVTQDWTVKETEIEDEYIIETVAKFDTRVPKPILTVELPDDYPEVYGIIPVKVINRGIIQATDLSVSLFVSEGYKLEWVSDPGAEVIAAGDTLTFLAKLLPDSVDADRRSRAPVIINKAGCMELITKLMAKHMCGKYPDYVIEQKIKKYGGKYCIKEISDAPNEASGGNGFPSFEGSKTSGFHSSAESPAVPKKYCDKIENDEDDGMDPVKLPVVPDEEYKEQNCGEKPVLNCKMIPVKGKRYELRGLTADGSSQVKIILDPSTSLIPNSGNCTKVTDIRWELSKDVGTLEGSSLFEAVYTAPDDFDESLASKGNFMIETEAILRCTVVDDNGYTYNVESNPVNIKIFRPAIVFVHGLGDSGKCWNRLHDRLLTYEGYVKELTYLVDYDKTSTSKMSVNLPKIGEGLRNVRRQALEKGIIVGKTDIVAHGTGGILARLYAQSEKNENEINRLITINTPHAGSEFGDIMAAHPLLGGINAQMMFSLPKKREIWDFSGIEEIGTGSELISNMNNSYAPDIPVYAYGTEVINPELTNGLNLLNLGAEIIVNGYLENAVMVVGGTAGSAAGPAGTAGGALVGKAVGKILTLLIKYATMINPLNPLHGIKDLNQANPGDAWVSTESQAGGCDANFVRGNIGLHHLLSPRSKEVTEDIVKLLKDYTKSGYSTGWFKPGKRRFQCAGIPTPKGVGIDLLPDVLGNTIQAGESIMKYRQQKDEDYYKPSKASTRDNVSDEDDIQSCRTLEVKLTLPDDDRNYMMSLVSVDDTFFCFDTEEFTCPVPNYFKGDVKVTALRMDAEGKVYYESLTYPFYDYNATPESLEADDLYLEIGEKVSPVVYCRWSDGSLSSVEVTDVAFDTDGILTFSEGEVTGLKKGSSKATLSFEGLTLDVDAYVFAPDTTQEEDDSDAICSTVTLSFKQSMVMTRQAFEGQLTVNNGHTSATLRDFKLNLEVTDETGFRATEREFEIVPEELTGFQGSLDFESGWSLQPQTDGTVKVLFIPSRYAAEKEPKKYKFGGTFSYIDPFKGIIVTRTLEPVTLTVNPSPVLDLTYFLQRDVYADDPLTADVVESAEPAEFALVINNRGFGDAKNVRITTEQPTIVDNEKGLDINFEIESTQLNGSARNLVLGSSTVNNLDIIPAGGSAYAQWWLKSSLPGHFKSYDVNMTHVTSYDNPDLSLIDKLDIHELIHGFTVDDSADVPVRGFLANDIPDAGHIPDWLYFSDRRNEEMVSAGDNADVTEIGNDCYKVTLPSSLFGWTYFNIKDPADGSKEITSVCRVSDGMEMPSDNFWLTDRTLPDNKDPLYENRLHFVVNSYGMDSYIIEFKDKRETILNVSAIEPVYVNEADGSRYVEGVRIIFNKAVMEETFTTEDVALHRDGVLLNIDGALFTKEDATGYLISLEQLAQPEGEYTFTVVTSGILDEEGYAGNSVKTRSWGKSEQMGVVNPVASKEIRVFPLPMVADIKICGDFETPVNVGIYSTIGKVMYMSDSYVKGSLIDVSGWEPGVYIIRVSSDNVEHVIKAVKR